MNPEPLRIAYLARNLPVISETFIVREIAGLRRLGVKVKPLSLHACDRTVIHPEIPDLAGEVAVLICPRNPKFWLAHLFFALFSPIRYWGCLWRYVLTLKDSRRRAVRAWLYFAVAPYAALICRDAGIVHIHAHFANAATTIAMMAAHLLGITFSFTVHSHYETFIDNLLLPQKLTSASFVVSVSQFFIDKLQRHYPEAAQTDFHLIRCGIDTEAYAPVPPPNNPQPIILSVGRLVDTKGFPTLIEACALLRDRNLPFRCLIIGDGPDKYLLFEMIKKYGLSDQVTLLGRKQPAEIESYYAQSALLALPCCVSKLHDEPGNHDCLPFVLIEAMAKGIPVISTPMGAIPELVRDGETGLLIEPENPEALAAAIIRLLQDQDLAQRLAQAGRAQVVQEFDVSQTTSHLMHLFQEVAGNTPVVVK